MYFTENREDLERLNIAASNPGPYRIFAAVATSGWEEMAKRALLKQVKAYVEQGLKWKPSRQEHVRFKIYIHFGELYAELGLRSQTIKVRLEEIEKF